MAASLAKSLLITAALAPAAVVGETVLGVTVFSRHGDRTSKHYPGYTLTNLGFQQVHQVGAAYRQTYLAAGAPKQILGISEDKYVPAQLYASAPDQMVLLNTATAFLQGLYPPLNEAGSNEDNNSLSIQTLNNGTTVSAPLEGYQYVVLHGENTDSPQTIWIKGDDSCPAASSAQKGYFQSSAYSTILSSTKDFYAGLWDLVADVYDYKPENMSYKNAYDIFDLINVASIHNQSFPGIKPQDLAQLRTLADSWEAGQNIDAADPTDNKSIGGRTLAGAILNQLNQTVASSGKLKFSLFAGSYDTFMAFFGLSGLAKVSDNFNGLPDYASTMSFEIFTSDNVTAFPASTDDLQVRFLFRNGSDAGAPLAQFPLFGQPEAGMSWSTFVKEMQTRAITDVATWCSVCGSTEAFCPSSSSSSSPAGDASASSGSASGGNVGGLSNTVAGVIGAMVTLAVLAICGFVFFLVRRGKRPAALGGAGAGGAEAARAAALTKDKASFSS
ncbi:histidine phosphatase superfamily [Microdochium trichocladiopsis]|uniref:Histidine phosphatase superfamily n=1 Tax=Microdochium trichocladiopsis TaxID=1682393 RepID=A0A9P8YLY0_9PEZI|nr:histidine phosphatase superfamily [Microdochium trichocladiopsis]KAH7041454.1 histidine phosphatase superfamily [Microdochium trichocladiopsis]